MINVIQLLARQAAAQPSAPAITQRTGGRDLTISYAALERRVAAEASRYLQAGLVPGDRMLVLCPLSIDLYVAVLAMLRCGLTAVFVDPGAGLRRLSACCDAAQPRAVIASRTASCMRPLIPALRARLIWLGMSAKPGVAASSDPILVDPDHPATLTFTSGSTGQPRGVIRTHRFLETQQHAIVRDLELTPGQSCLTAMPMFVLAHLAAGVQSVLADVRLRRPSCGDARRLCHQIMTCHPDRLLASPSLLERLSDYARANQITFNSVQRVDTGGAPVFPRTVDRLRAVMPHAQLVIVYGSTEAEPIAIYRATPPCPAVHQQIARGAGLPAGQPATDLDVRLLDPTAKTPAGPLSSAELDARCLPALQVGEIIVQGDRVIGGYLDGSGDKLTKLQVDGRIWHRTGDLGRFDHEGKLWLLGRAAAQLHDAHGTVQALAVEAAAMEIDAIARCALVAIRGRRCLVVELIRGARDDWRTLLDQRLAWAQLDRVIRVRRIPVDRRHRAKIDYPALRRMVGADWPTPGTTRTVPAAPFISTQSPS